MSLQFCLLARADYHVPPHLDACRMNSDVPLLSLDASAECVSYAPVLHDIKRCAKLEYTQDSGAESAAKMLTKDEARRIAANIAKLPELCDSAGKIYLFLFP